MARAKYTVDPEALSLVGPNSFADAFSSALRGARLGDSMATSALNRELGRERNRRIEDDRKIAAAMSVSPGGVSVAPTVSSGKGKSSAGSVSFSPISMSDWQRQTVGAAKAAEIPDLKLRPMFDGDPDIIWGTPSTPYGALDVRINTPEESAAVIESAAADTPEMMANRAQRNAGAALSANEYFRQQPTSESRISQKAMERVQSGELTPNQAERFTQDALAMERMSPTRGFVDVPMQNPAERVGYRSDYLQTPQEFQSFLLTRRGDLSRAELEKTQQDYENYYAQRTGMYRDDMSLMRRAAQIASEREAQEAALAADAAADQKRNELLPAYRTLLKPIKAKFNYSDEDIENIAFAAYENGIDILDLAGFTDKAVMDSLKEEGLDLRSKRKTGLGYSELAEKKEAREEKANEASQRGVAAARLAQSVIDGIEDKYRLNSQPGYTELSVENKDAIANEIFTRSRAGKSVAPEDVKKMVDIISGVSSEIEGVPERVTKEDALVFLQPLSAKGVSPQMINLMAESWARGDRQDVRLMRQLVAPGASKEDLENIIKNWEKTTQSQGSSAGSSSGDSEIISVDLG